MPQPIAADVVLAPLLAGPAAVARMVAATPHALYARHPGGAVLALLDASAVRVPGALVVAGGLPAVGDHLVVGAGGVTAGGVLLTVRRWWDSAVPRVRRVAPPCPPEVAHLLPDAVSAGAARLAEALAGPSTDADRVGPAVAALVGLGPGLTPAGDDVVAGALVALVAADDERAGPLADAVRARLHRTGTVSAALLRHATAGRAVPQLARYLADPGRLPDLLAVGGTSGAALARGAHAGLSVAAATMSPVEQAEAVEKAEAVEQAQQKEVA